MLVPFHNFLYFQVSGLLCKLFARCIPKQKAESIGTCGKVSVLRLSKPLTLSPNKVYTSKGVAADSKYTLSMVQQSTSLQRPLTQRGTHTLPAVNSTSQHTGCEPRRISSYTFSGFCQCFDASHTTCPVGTQHRLTYLYVLVLFYNMTEYVCVSE